MYLYIYINYFLSTSILVTTNFEFDAIINNKKKSRIAGRKITLFPRYLH